MGLNKLAAFSCMSLTLACAGVAEADSFSNGQFVTYSQNDWGSGTAAVSLLDADYSSVYASTGDLLIVGVTGTSGQYFMAFTAATDITSFIPAIGPAGPLTESLENPSTSPAGVFGGDVVALTLNIDFNNAGFLHGTSSVPFGDLVLTNLGNFSPDLAALNGLTVSEFLAIANTCLSDGSCPYGLDNVATLTDHLNFSFESGTAYSSYDQYLALPSSAPTPEPSSLLLLAPALAGLGFLRRARQHDGRSPPSPASGLSSPEQGQGNPRFQTGGLPWA